MSVQERRFGLIQARDKIANLRDEHWPRIVNDDQAYGEAYATGWLDMKSDALQIIDELISSFSAIEEQSPQQPSTLE